MVVCQAPAGKIFYDLNHIDTLTYKGLALAPQSVTILCIHWLMFV